MLCLAVTIGWFLYRAGDDATEVLARNALMDTMNRVGQATDRQLLGARETLRVVAPDPIPPAEKGGQPVYIPFPKEKAALEERLWLANSLFDEPSYVYFGGADGSFLGVKQEERSLFMYSTRDPQGKNYVYHLRGPGTEPTLIATQDYEPRNRPWYRQAIERKQETWSPVFTDFRLKFLGISLSKPVYTPDHVLLGVATSSIGLLQLSEFLQTLPLTRNGVAFIIDMSGDLVATSVHEPIHKVNGENLVRLNAAQSSSPVVRQAYADLVEYMKKQKLAPEKLIIQSLQTDGPKTELAFRLHHDVAGLDWVAVSAVSRSDFLGSVTGGVYQTLLLGLVAVCMTFVLGFAILRWVLRDIRKLTLAAKSIGNGEPFPSLNIERRDEIGQLAQSFQEMERNLRTDRLTNVLNRDSFIAQIDFRRRKGNEAVVLQFALLFIDLDRFKSINDQYGHDEGDKVLISAASQLQNALRKEDSVARFGGDEFVVYLHGVSDENVAKSIAEKIRTCLNQPIEGRDGNKYHVDASIGMALFPQDGLDIETLLRVADERMFEQKRMHRMLSYDVPHKQ
ncbi:diguanylate cyclase [Herbaspirillum sp. RV1423]|uniref:sensor domain-containing diguanylate cyclase n=1 Tax=Herbaspirillum sp. RV1423 TaxID=1443993 RepID=UPI0006883206|nr:diguanylate cyclase [Herbaspirillum sp. RV1423]